MSSKKTKWGFPRGKVAQMLRSILSKEFTDDDVNTIAVVLLSHSLVEAAIEQVIYLVLNSEFPHYIKKGANPEETIKFKNLNKKIEENLSKTIQDMSFFQKFSLIKPCLETCSIDEIKNLNEIRNKIAHLKRLDDLKFKGKLIWSEEGLEEFFVTSQFVVITIDKLREWIDDQHALYRKMERKLRELGEPLY